LLLDIIEEILPKNAIHWEQVCDTYRERANEDDVRDVDSVKRHFNEKLCNKHQKTTGEARAKAMVERAQTLYKQIADESNAVVYGGQQDSDDEDEDNDEDEGDGEDRGIGEQNAEAAAGDAHSVFSLPH